MKDRSVQMAAARRAYEWARARHALASGVWVLPLFCASAFQCSQPHICFSIAMLLWFVASFLRWRGMSWGRSVLPGLAFGGASCVLPFLMHVGGHGCGPGLCWSGCQALCLSTGAASGFALAHWGINKARSDDDIEAVPYLIGAGTIASLTGTLGCLSMGLASAVTLATVLFLSCTTTALLLPQRSSNG